MRQQQVWRQVGVAAAPEFAAQIFLPQSAAAPQTSSPETRGRAPCPASCDNGQRRVGAVRRARRRCLSLPSKARAGGSSQKWNTAAGAACKYRAGQGRAGRGRAGRGGAGQGRAGRGGAGQDGAPVHEALQLAAPFQLPVLLAVFVFARRCHLVLPARQSAQQLQRQGGDSQRKDRRQVRG